MAPRKAISKSARPAQGKASPAAKAPPRAARATPRSRARITQPKTPRATQHPRSSAKPQGVPRVIPVEVVEKNREAAPVVNTATRATPVTRPLTPPREGTTFVQAFSRDFDSLTVFWQTSAAAMSRLTGEVGERTLALARPTLRLTDEHGLKPDFVLLPEEAHSCSLRIDPRRVAYRVEYGYTLPSGEFRRIAESPMIRPPSPAPPSRVATASARYDAADRPPTVEESRRRIEQAVRAGDRGRAQAIAEDTGVDVVAVLDQRADASSDAAVASSASDQYRPHA